MLHQALMFFGGDVDLNNLGVWIFLSVGAVALFVVFIPTVTWLDNRRKEREAFYKAETFRRVAESSSEGANAAVQLLREQERYRRINAREGLKIAGLINLGVGIGVVIFLGQLVGRNVALCGLIPAMVGVAMLAYVFFLAVPIE
jgi:hypothetical protein